jgi:hypothetical protein
VPLIQKSLELCNEVRSLGGALLAALEKGDAEHMALIRQRHEIQIQQLTQDIRFLQWKSAEESTRRCSPVARPLSSDCAPRRAKLADGFLHRSELGPNQPQRQGSASGAAIRRSGYALARATIVATFLKKNYLSP